MAAVRMRWSGRAPRGSSTAAASREVLAGAPDPAWPGPGPGPGRHLAPATCCFGQVHQHEPAVLYVAGGQEELVVMIGGQRTPCSRRAGRLFHTTLCR